MRPVAYKVKIEELLNGEYRRSADGSEPPHLLSPWGLKLSRARIMGTVVDKFLRDDGSYSTLTIDDGTGVLRLKAWGRDVGRISGVGVGALVDVIGRVKEFEGEVYLTPEILMMVPDPNWEVVRDLEIVKNRRKLLARGVKPKVRVRPEPTEVSAGQTEIPDTVNAEPLPPSPSEEIKEKVLVALSGYPDGAGASDISGKIGLDRQEVEEALKELLLDGKVYEPEAGKYRAVV